MEKIFSTYDFQNLLIIWCMTHMGALLVILILVDKMRCVFGTCFNEVLSGT